MRSAGRITSTRLHVPTLLVVAGEDPGLLERCRVAAVSSGIVVKGCSPAEAPTQAAERRPLAIVVPGEVYALDGLELDALARDVRSTLLLVDAEVHELELEAMIAGAIRTCLTQRERRAGAGRYALHQGGRSETPYGGAIGPGNTALRAPGVAPQPTEPPPRSFVRPRAHCTLDTLFEDQGLPLAR